MASWMKSGVTNMTDKWMNPSMCSCGGRGWRGWRGFVRRGHHLHRNYKDLWDTLYKDLVNVIWTELQCSFHSTDIAPSVLIWRSRLIRWHSVAFSSITWKFKSMEAFNSKRMTGWKFQGCSSLGKGFFRNWTRDFSHSKWESYHETN
jgi:hypothetical protein